AGQGDLPGAGPLGEHDGGGSLGLVAVEEGPVRFHDRDPARRWRGVRGRRRGGGGRHLAGGEVQAASLAERVVGRPGRPAVRACQGGGGGGWGSRGGGRGGERGPT